jgi:hypothetical protein
MVLEDQEVNCTEISQSTMTETPNPSTEGFGGISAKRRKEARDALLAEIYLGRFGGFLLDFR